MMVRHIIWLCCIYWMFLCRPTEAQDTIQECFKPEIPKFATYNYTEKRTLFPGTIVEYTCDRNYNLIGSKHRKCMSDGTWMPETPSCEMTHYAMCIYPGQGLHMILDAEEFNYTTNSTIFYSCEIGYVLVGPKQRICFANGTWSDYDPFCASKLAMHKSIVDYSGYVDVKEASDNKGIRILDDHNLRCSVADMANRQKPFWKIDLLEELQVDVVALIFGNYQEITADLFWGVNITEDKEISPNDYRLVTWAGRTGQQEMSSLEYTLKEPIRMRYLKIEVHTIPSSRLYFCEALVLSKKEPSFGDCYSSSPSQLKDLTTTIKNKQCYSFAHSQENSFMAAQGKCKELRNGSLATDVDLDTQLLLSHDLYGVHQYRADKNYWIGGHQDQEDDAKGRLVWQWINKHKIQDFFWASGQPDGNDVSCLSLNGKSYWSWDDRSCDDRLSYICQHGLLKCGYPDTNKLCKIKGSQLNRATDVNSVVTYECPHGFSVKGSITRKCLSDGTWSGSAPYCSEDTGNPEKQNEDKKKGLPAGAIAAVVVGLVLAIIIILLVIFFVMYKKRSGSAEIKYNKKAESAEVLDVHDKKGSGGKQNYAATDEENK